MCVKGGAEVGSRGRIAAAGFFIASGLLADGAGNMIAHATPALDSVGADEGNGGDAGSGQKDRPNSGPRVSAGESRRGRTDHRSGTRRTPRLLAMVAARPPTPTEDPGHRRWQRPFRPADEPWTSTGGARALTVAAREHAVATERHRRRNRRARHGVGYRSSPDRPSDRHRAARGVPHRLQRLLEDCGYFAGGRVGGAGLARMRILTGLRWARRVSPGQGRTCGTYRWSRKIC